MPAEQHAAVLNGLIVLDLKSIRLPARESDQTELLGDTVVALLLGALEGRAQLGP